MNEVGKLTTRVVYGELFRRKSNEQNLYNATVHVCSSLNPK